MLPLSPMVITFIILAVAIVLFVTEKVPAYVTTILVPLALVWTHVLPLAAAFEGFVNSTILMLAGMFVVSIAMMDTGIAWRISNWLMPLAKTERQAGVMFFVLSAVISAVTPNVGASLMMFPIVLTFARSKRFQPSTVLMPYIFGINIGGISTMMGTGLAPVLQNAMIEHGSDYVIKFFDFTKFGAPTIIACAVYIGLIGYRFYPANGLEVKGQVDAGKDDYSDVPAWKQVLVVIALLSIAASMIFDGWPPMAQISMTAGVAMVVTGVIGPQRAIEAINLRTLFLIAGMFSLSKALEVTGGVTLIANTLANIIGTNVPDFVLLFAMWLTVNLVSEFMSSNAAILLMMPVCLELSTIFGCSPVPMLFALFAGGVSVNASPYAAPTNAMIYEPGGYTFKDFIVNGLPVTLICGVVSVACICIFFPLYG